MKKTIKYGFTLMAIASVCAGILAYTYEYTKPYIERTAKNLEQSARIDVVGNGYTFKEDEKKVSEGLEFIPAYKDEKLSAYVVKVVSNEGYGGEIVFSMGIDLEGKITGLKVIDSKETPGLGAKIQGDIEKEGKIIPWGNIWIGRDKNYRFDKSTDAFAGATVSPMAVYSSVKKALETFDKISMNKIDEIKEEIKENNEIVEDKTIENETVEEGEVKINE